MFHVDRFRFIHSGCFALVASRLGVCSCSFVHKRVSRLSFGRCDTVELYFCYIYTYMLHLNWNDVCIRHNLLHNYDLAKFLRVSSKLLHKEKP